MKKIYFLSLFLCVLCIMSGCSKDDDNGGGQGSGDGRVTTDEIYYANQFAYDALDTYYLWKDEIAAEMQKLDPNVNEDPIGTVKDIRFKENNKEIDKWTMMTDDMESLINNMDGVATTYGYNLMLGKFSNSENYFFIVAFVYEGSPAYKVGIKRGDIIMQLNGKEITKDNYQEALYSSNITLGMGEQKDGYIGLSGQTLTLDAVTMYENPILVHKTFDVGGKKVGYLAYSSFDLDSAEKLVDICCQFKQEGISELILDLRYNGGGYVFTENVLAFMLAPENVVKSKAVYETEIWNKDLMEYYKKKGEDLNTYFSTVVTNGSKTIDVGRANVGITKIYGLIGSGTASASESVLIGLMPYMAVELIGGQSHGKYCTGALLGPENIYSKFPSVIKNWGLYVMINRYADKDGNNPCMPDGLKPDYPAEDNPLDGYQLGDENESLLRLALDRAAGKTDRSGARTVSLLPYELTPMTVNPLFGKRIDNTLIDKIERKQIEECN